MKTRTTKLEAENKTLSQKVESVWKEGQRWYNELKPIVERFSRYTPEQLEKLDLEIDQRDRVDAHEHEQKTQTEIEAQLKKEGSKESR